MLKLNQDKAIRGPAGTRPRIGIYDPSDTRSGLTRYVESILASGAARDYEFTLFRRAGAALYVAKRAGRNRLEMLGPDDASPLTEVEAAIRAARRAPPPDAGEALFTKLRA